MGNPRVTQAVPAPTPVLNLYPLPQVQVPASMTHGYPSHIVTLPHHPGHPFIIPFITSPATTAAAAAAPANEDDMATMAAAAAANTNEDDAATTAAAAAANAKFQ